MSVAAGATQRSRAERNDHLACFLFLSAFLPIKKYYYYYYYQAEECQLIVDVSMLRHRATDPATCVDSVVRRSPNIFGVS